MHAVAPAIVALALVAATPAAARPHLDARYGGGDGVAAPPIFGDVGYADQVVSVGGGRALVRGSDDRVVALDRRGRVSGQAPGGYDALAARGRVVAAVTTGYVDAQPIHRLQRLTPSGELAGAPQQIGSNGFFLDLLARTRGGWLFDSTGHDATSTETRNLLALDTGGAPDPAFGNAGTRSFPASRDLRFAVDGHDRLLVAQLGCDNKRSTLLVQRYAPDGVTPDARWQPKAISLGSGCRRSRLDGLTPDITGGAVLATVHHGRGLFVLRVTPSGLDRRVGRRGFARAGSSRLVGAGAVTRALPIGRRIAVAINGSGSSALIVLDRSGRRRGRVGLGYSFVRELAAAPRARVLAAGAELTDDAGFDLREDFAVPSPAVWRVTTR